MGKLIMRYTIESGQLNIQEKIAIPETNVLDASNGIRVFKPTKEDPESGIITDLRKYAIAKHIVGDHMFWVHEKPPLPHHPAVGNHKIFWVGKKETQIGEHTWTDKSWTELLNDREFLERADKMFEEIQKNADEVGENLRVSHEFGFATQKDIAAIGKRNVLDRSRQSQIRAHIHLFKAVGYFDEWVEWLGKTELLENKSLLPRFLDTAGGLAINRYSNSFRDFGTRVIYNQTVSTNKNDKVAPNGLIYNVERTMFAFSSWEEALGSVLDLYNELLNSWLDTAHEISQISMIFANEQIKLLQGCLPGFTFIRPSPQDKTNGKIDQSINWLVVPFSTSLTQAIMSPGVWLNRINPNADS